jgi:hypothetical protein
MAMRAFAIVASISLLAACSEHVPVCPDVGPASVLAKKRFFRIDDQLDYWQAALACGEARGTIGTPQSPEEWDEFVIACRTEPSEPDANCWYGDIDPNEVWRRYQSDDPHLALAFPVCETWIPEE